jgi:hypothetical protein
MNEVQAAIDKFVSMTPTERQFAADLEEGQKLMQAEARRQRFEEVAKARHERRRQQQEQHNQGPRNQS